MAEKQPPEILNCENIIDSHAHYFDKRFENESEGADEILAKEVFGRGISAVINVGTRNETNILAINQALKYENMYVAVGIHPEDAQRSDVCVEDELSALRALVENPEKRKQNKIVAIGEIGLDYYWQPVDKPLQQKCFDSQLSLARELDMPVIIHDREAHGDCFETILRYPEVRGVFHSYSGSAEMALELVKRGWYISFSGVLTFKNARKAVEAAEQIPLDRILIETDAPYLAPTPFRGKLNHSGLMGSTAQTLANIKSISVEQAILATAENARNFFGI